MHPPDSHTLFTFESTPDLRIELWENLRPGRSPSAADSELQSSLRSGFCDPPAPFVFLTAHAVIPSGSVRTVTTYDRKKDRKARMREKISPQAPANRKLWSTVIYGVKTTRQFRRRIFCVDYTMLSAISYEVITFDHSFFSRSTCRGCRAGTQVLQAVEYYIR